jgi:pimeloyl-ACP methyl ester carboxylesterase
LLFVHGLWVNGDLWRKVIPHLASRYRCITPDWPFGAHAFPLQPDADLSPSGIGDLIAAFCEALDLQDVTIIANDTGVAFAQLFVACHCDKLSRLVLDACKPPFALGLRCRFQEGPASLPAPRETTSPLKLVGLASEKVQEISALSVPQEET